MDEYISDVALVRRLGKAPVLFDFVRQRLQRRQLFPAVAPVLAAEKSDGLDAGINDIVVGRVDRNGADVAVERFAPRFSRVESTVEAVVGHADVDALGMIVAAVDRVDNAVAKGA